jgi:hypothetical protein
MAESFSVYPNAIDGYTTLPLRRDGVHEIVADDHNRLRDAIVKIEQELGVQPSGVYATVVDRLDDIGDASALINAHLIDAIDAHDASAISLLDTSDFYSSDNVEGAITELAAVLPASLDVIGEDNTAIPNSGIPDFVSGSGTRFGINTSPGTGNILTNTQPINITGIHIIEVGEDNGGGTASLRMATVGKLQWSAPGESFGAEVDLLSLSTGDIVTLESDTATKRIRIARTTAALPTSGSLPLTDTFDILKLEAASGAFSITSVGIRSTDFVTRTASSSTGTSRNQFMVGGMVFPADKGTLVLQRKLRGSPQFFPIATLDLASNFDEDKRDDGQPVYIPSLEDFDTITLFDRLPAKNDYESLDGDSDGNQVYDNLDISADFPGQQLAKYSIPVSNPNIISGTLEAPTNISLSEADLKVSAYRIVHFKSGITDFNGNPDASNIFNISDALGSSNDGYNNVRMSNVYVDTDTTRPTINPVNPTILRPNVPSAEVLPKFISGINYYNSPDDKFDLEFQAFDVFKNTYLEDNILTFSTDAFFFPSGSGFGQNVGVEELFDDAYGLFSDTNLPTFSDEAFYLINDTVNSTRKLYPDENKFSTNARVSATINDPFGPSNTYDAYGYITSSETAVRVLINSFDRYRATNTQEFFTDESRRVGTSEEFLSNLEREQFTHSYVSGDGYSLAVWDNTQALSVGGTGTNGELQCGGRFSDDTSVPGLIFPQSDYSTNIAPGQTNSPDYSSSSYFTNVDELIYQRLFNLGFSTNGGRLRIVSGGSSLVSFNDIRAGNASRPIKISVKIPGTGSNSTGWMDVGKLFETGRYGSDGANDGALFGTVTGGDGDFTVNFTFGQRNTSDTQDMIAVRVSYFGSQVSTAKTKILTMLELLE